MATMTFSTLTQDIKDWMENDNTEFENENVIGSISLTGAAIDDLTFKNYKTSLDRKEKVIQKEKTLS